MLTREQVIRNHLTRIFIILSALCVFTQGVFASSDSQYIYTLFSGEDIYNASSGNRQRVEYYSNDGVLLSSNTYPMGGRFEVSGSYCRYFLYMGSRYPSGTGYFVYSVPFTSVRIVAPYMLQIGLDRFSMVLPQMATSIRLERIDAVFKAENGSTLYSSFVLPSIEYDEEAQQQILTSTNIYADIPDGAYTFEGIDIVFKSSSSNIPEFNSPTQTDYYVGLYGIGYTSGQFDPVQNQIAEDLNNLINYQPTPTPPDIELNPDEEAIYNDFSDLWDSSNWYQWNSTYGDMRTSRLIFDYVFQKMYGLQAISTMIGFLTAWCILKAVI